MNNIAIIFARGDSKRNTLEKAEPLRGRPVAGWTIEAVLESGCFSIGRVSINDAKVFEVLRTVFKSAPSSLAGCIRGGLR